MHMYVVMVLDRQTLNIPRFTHHPMKNEMLRNVLALFLVFSLIPHAQADYESAKAAYEAGDYETALEILIPLAEAGDANAQTGLGVMYERGVGVQQSYAEAIKWYDKAAEQGSANAQHNLGFMYFKGLSVPQDAIKAYAWNELAIAGGSKLSQNARDVIGAKLNATQLKKARKLAKELREKYGNKSKN